MSIRINMAERIVQHVRIEIQRLWIVEFCIRYRLSLSGPVRGHKPAHRTAVVARFEVVIP